jgi:Zn-dependent metalloprotease
MGREEDQAPAPNPEKLKEQTVDKVSLERLQKLIALEVADDATKRLVDRGKWIMGGVAALLAALGLSTYLDIRKDVESIKSEVTSNLKTETTNLLSGFQGDLSRIKTDIGKLDADLDSYRKQVASKAEQTIKEIENRGALSTQLIAKVSSQLIAKVSSSAPRKIFSSKQTTTLPGTVVRSEGQPPTGDALADSLYDILGEILSFWKSEYGRDSYDGQGGAITAVVHFGRNYNNCFWNGSALVVGDGDGKIFKTFVDLKIISANFTHAIVGSTSKLTYANESGALNSHLSDVFGVLVSQWKRQETVEQSNWLIGDGIFGPTIKSSALRSLKNPGSAYDDPVLGKDPQSSSMSDYKNSGDPHINSGIPNHAFYLAATKIGGYAWQKIGRIWYEAMIASKSNDNFKTFGKTTISKAATLFGANSKEKGAVKEAWVAVGVDVDH